MTMGGSSISQPDPDRGLVEQARQGNAEAFAGLVEQYQRLLTSLALGILHDEVRAEDVVQETFVAAWRSLSGFRGEARFRNWLCRILVNKAHSELRWGGLRRWLRLDSPSDEQKALVDCLKDTGADADPESGALHSEQSREIRKTVAALPKKQRTAVLLRAHGMEVTDVAQTMGVAEGTVKAHLHQARERLQKLLEDR